MTSDDREDTREAWDAAMWRVRLDEEGASCRAEFEEWSERSACHRQEFLAVSEMSRRLTKLDPRHEIDVEQLISLTSETRDASSKRTARARANRRLPLRSLAAAAALIALVLAGWAALTHRVIGVQSYTTGLGEQRKVELEDGSVIHLNTDSKVNVRYTNKDRTLSLLRGEALFSVKRDVQRPFYVNSGFARVKVLGTEFDIFRRPARTTVSVIAGEVSVLPSKGNGAPADTDRRQYASSPGVPNGSRLAAGEQVSVGPDGRIGTIERPDIAKILQWREGRLTFEEAPLEEVAEEFNRYNTMKIVIEGAALQARPVSGIYSSDHPETLIRELQSKDSNIAVTKTADAFVLRSK